MKKIRKAVFPVAGLGTRFLPATKSLPKEMLTVIDRPLIQYAVEEAKAAGIEEFIFVTGRGKTALEDFFDYSYELNATLEKRGNLQDLASSNEMVLSPGKIIYTRQQEPLGLGHAVWCARHIVGNEPFAVLLADDLIRSKTIPCLSQMVKAYSQMPGNYVAALSVPDQDVQNYGIIQAENYTDSVFRICDLVEKPSCQKAPSNWAVIGRYILEPSIFQYLDELSMGIGGEIQLTDAMQKLLKTSKFFGLPFEGKRFDCGSKRGMLEATLAYAAEHEELSSVLETFIQEMKK